MQKKQFLKNLPSVAIVTVTRNRSEPLLRLLSQLLEMDYPQQQLGFFVVDSTSTDGTVEKVQRYFPDVHLTISGRNLGIAAGFNMGIKAALKDKKKFKYIWLVDDDAVIEKKTLKPLVETAEADSNIAVIGSAVYDIDKPKHLVTAGLNIDWKKATVLYNKPEMGKAEKLFDVDIIPACSSLTRAYFFRKIGLWDELLWLYWGDTEWCARAKRHGFRVCCHGKSRVWHRNWATVKPDFFYPYLQHDRIRSGLLFNLRHNPNNSIAGVRHLVLKSYLKAALENFTLRPNFSRACIEGVQDFLKGFFSKKDFSSWSDDFKVCKINEICQDLKGKIPENSRIVLNQIVDISQKTEIKKIFTKNFHRVKWSEIPDRMTIRKEHLSDHYYEYIFYHIPRFFLYLSIFLLRKDLIISQMVNPDLYNIAAARYTLFLDSSMRACVVKNQLFKALATSFKTILKGLIVVFFDLPHALKNCEKLKKAVGAGHLKFSPFKAID